MVFESASFVQKPRKWKSWGKGLRHRTVELNFELYSIHWLKIKRERSVDARFSPAHGSLNAYRARKYSRIIMRSGEGPQRARANKRESEREERKKRQRPPTAHMNSTRNRVRIYSRARNHMRKKERKSWVSEQASRYHHWPTAMGRRPDELHQTRPKISIFSSWWGGRRYLCSDLAYGFSLWRWDVIRKYNPIGSWCIWLANRMLCHFYNMVCRHCLFEGVLNANV